jgi:hypothetical protein
MAGEQPVPTALVKAIGGEDPAKAADEAQQAIEDIKASLG